MYIVFNIFMLSTIFVLFLAFVNVVSSIHKEPDGKEKVYDLVVSVVLVFVYVALLLVHLKVMGGI